jgi:hypothetical protein
MEDLILRSIAKRCVSKDEAQPAMHDPPICLTGKSLSNFLSIPLGKNIPLLKGRKSATYAAHPVPHEGRFAIVTDVGYGMRWTRRRSRRERLLADGEVVWS